MLFIDVTETFSDANSKHLNYRTRARSLVMLVTHSLPDSLTDSLTDSCLVNLMAMNDTNCLMMSQQLLKLEDDNSKVVEVVTVADVVSEDHVDNSLLQIWEVTFGPKSKFFIL